MTKHGNTVPVPLIRQSGAALCILHGVVQVQIKALGVYELSFSTVMVRYLKA
jgi:hypothetical protein